MGLGEIFWGRMEWIQLAQDRGRGGMLWLRLWTFWFWCHRISIQAFD
jgi:hypothetical protein